MAEPSSENVTINNPADIAVIAGYFLMVIGVGVWVGFSDNVPDDYEVREEMDKVGISMKTFDLSVCCSPCFGPIVGRWEDISWQDGQWLGGR